MADEQRPNNPSSNFNRRPVDDEWFRNFLRREFELIGVNANTDSSRERTRSNFAFTDSLNNQLTKDALSYLLEIYKDRDLMDDVLDRARQRKGGVAELRKGVFSSVGEWGGRLITGAIGAAVSWYFLSGKH